MVQQDRREFLKLAASLVIGGVAHEVQTVEITSKQTLGEAWLTKGDERVRLEHVDEYGGFLVPPEFATVLSSMYFDTLMVCDCQISRGPRMTMQEVCEARGVPFTEEKKDDANNQRLRDALAVLNRCREGREDWEGAVRPSAVRSAGASGPTV